MSETVDSCKWVLGEDRNELNGDHSRPPFDLGTDHFLRYGGVLEKSEKKGDLNVIIKEQMFDSSKVGTYASDEEKKEVYYEPRTLNEFVGQEKAKAKIEKAIKQITMLREKHILLDGWPGCGKTTLAKIIARRLNAHFIYKVPEDLSNVEELERVINEIQTTDRLTVFMVDEIHRIFKYKSLVNVLLPVLENFRYGGKRIRPFVMIGATTDKNCLAAKEPALLSRFGIPIRLRKYEPDELAQIIFDAKNNLYPEFAITDKDREILARNSRGIPRKAITLMEARLVSQNIQEVLDDEEIIRDGITEIDAEILLALYENEKPMGASYLSQVVDITQDDYEKIYEGFLVQQKYIKRLARGRTIAEKGKQFLKETGKITE